MNSRSFCHDKIRLSSEKFMLTPLFFRATIAFMKYIYKPYLPANGVHCLAGTYGTGKTTLLFQILPLLMIPFAYIMADRSLEAYEETRVRIEAPLFPCFSIIDAKAASIKDKSPKPGTWLQWTEEWIKTLTPSPELLVFDTGITALPAISNFNDQRQTTHAMVDLKAWCLANQKTVILVWHTSKTKKTEDYFTIFNRTSGSHALLAFADSKAVLTSPDEHPDGASLFLRGQNFPDTQFKLDRDEVGRFTLRVDNDEYDIMSLIGDDEVSIDDLTAATGKSRSSVYRQISKCVEAGMLKQPRRGMYACQAYS